MLICVCFFKQKTAYEMRTSDWSSDVCSSDLERILRGAEKVAAAAIDDAVRRAIGQDTLIDRGILERRVELAIGAVDADLPVIAEALFGANDIFIDRLVFVVGGDEAAERRDRAVSYAERRVGNESVSKCSCR